MKKHLQQKMKWMSSRAGILFLLFISITLLGLSAFQFVKRNNDIAFFSLAASILFIFIAFCLLLKEMGRAKKIGKELILQQEHFSAALSSLSEGLITTSKNGEILYMNAAAERITGWKSREVLTQPLSKVYNVVNEETGKPFENIVSRILREGRPVEWENHTILKTKDFKQLIIRSNGSPLFDSNGNISGAVLLFNDITEKKEIENLIRRSEDKYRSLIEQASDAIIIYSIDGTIHEFNNSCCTLSGYSNEEFAKLKLSDVLTEDVIVNQANYAAILAGNAVTLYRKFKQKDGLIVEMEVNVKMQADGKITAFGRDITERKKAEEAIKKEKELSDSVINSMPGVFYFYDANLKLLRWNKQLETVTGYSAAELSNMNPADFFEGEDKKYMQKASRKVFAEGRGDAEASFTTKAGRKIPFYFTGLLMQNEGKPSLLGIGIDITERKKAEKDLAESENYLRTIVQAEPECVKLLNINGELLEMNPAGLAMIEADNLEQVKGKSVLGIIEAAYRKPFEKLTQNIFQGKSGTLEFKITGLKGTGRWLETNAVPLKDAEGKIISLLGVTRDITERKKAEETRLEILERYEILSNTTHDTIWDLNILNGKMLYNDGITDMFGYKKEEIENKIEWWKNKIYPDDLLRVSEVLDNVVEGKKQKVQLDYRFRCANGSYKYVYDRVFVIYDETGNPLRMIGAMQDFTYQKEEELRMGKAVIDAQELERRQIGMELHDNVNQILSASLLYLAMANDKQKENKAASEMIKAGSGYIGEAITEIRRLSHHLAPVSFKDISLREIFESLISSMNTGNRFSVDFEFDCFEKDAISDDIQINLYRILQEQMKNILKYAEASHVEISVTLTEQLVRLKIADNGKGFNVNAVKNGIGLENMRRRVKLFSGEINISSSPGNGCEILVGLPLKNND